jgi:hypothetical protein
LKLLKAKQLEVHPPLDLETYMFLAQVKGMEGKDTVELLSYWSKWAPSLKVYRLGEKKGYVLAYLGQEVDMEVDEIWDKSPAMGFKLEALAQTMIMGVMRSLLPELSSTKCAPVPKPNKILKRSLGKIGLEFSAAGALNYKYSTITFFPYRGGCELCYLKPSCPKAMFPKMDDIFKTNNPG